MKKGKVWTYLADITPLLEEEAYRKALEKKPVKERILRDIRTCRRLAEEYEVMTGEKL